MFFVFLIDIGHVAFLAEAKKLGNYLVVGLHNDSVF